MSVPPSEATIKAAPRRSFRIVMICAAVVLTNGIGVRPVSQADHYDRHR
jgi:hypothetical protein